MRTVITAVLGVAAFALPASALAAPTASDITTPTSPTFIQYDRANPGTVHVEGTTSGGTGDVDLRCYVGASSGLIKAGVPVAGGSFSTDVQLSDAVYSTMAQSERYCVLRAVPTGTAPAAAPDSASSWQGPELSWGQAWGYALGLAGAPNPPETLYDYWISEPQQAAYDDYDSVASCGLCDTFLHKPGTFARSNPIWWANSAIYFHIPGADPFTRSAMQVDGVDAYTASAATPPGLKTSVGFPGLSYSYEVDPANGDLTIHETSPFATCSPQPAVYPPTNASCASFTKVLELQRTITQRKSGRQVTITDDWSSADGQQHQLDAYYDETTDDANYLTAGHDTTWDLSWTSDGFKSYPAGTQLPVAGSAGRSLFVKPDGATPDSGDGMNPIGALTYGQEPSELILRRASATNGVANWQERYQRSVPASGRVTIVHVYSHAFSLAEVQALAQEAAAALGAPADATPAPAESAPAGASLAPSPAATPSATAAPKCRVPKLKGRTLRAAKLGLRKAHCRVGKVSRRSSARVRAGRVIGSKPGPGRVRAAGTRIAVTVARAELASQN